VRPFGGARATATTHRPGVHGSVKDESSIGQHFQECIGSGATSRTPRNSRVSQCHASGGAERPTRHPPAAERADSVGPRRTCLSQGLWWERHAIRAAFGGVLRLRKRSAGTPSVALPHSIGIKNQLAHWFRLRASRIARIVLPRSVMQTQLASWAQLLLRRLSVSLKAS